NAYRSRGRILAVPTLMDEIGKLGDRTQRAFVAQIERRLRGREETPFVRDVALTCRKPPDSHAPCRADDLIVRVLGGVFVGEREGLRHLGVADAIVAPIAEAPVRQQRTTQDRGVGSEYRRV